MRKLISNTLKYWIPLAITITALCGLVYLTVQQNIRLSANSYQIQASEDAVTRLNQDQPLQSVVPQNKVNIAQSIAPFVIIYDSSGKPVLSSAELDGQTPNIPNVFPDVATRGQLRFTWQPKEGVRSAVVISPYQNSTTSGFVLAGKSLREVEKLEDWIMIQVALAWLVTLGSTLIATVILQKFIK